MADVTLQIENMHCGSCVRRVTQTLNALPATRAAEVRVGSARVHTEADPAELIRALGEAGFPAHLAAGAE
jgi:copper chaperone CopZ